MKSIRIIKKELLFVTGFPKEFKEYKSHLHLKWFFGQYGKVKSIDFSHNFLN